MISIPPVFSADQGEIHEDDPDDPIRTAIRQVMGTFAELDRKTLAKQRSFVDGPCLWHPPPAAGRGVTEWALLSGSRDAVPEDDSVCQEGLPWEA